MYHALITHLIFYEENARLVFVANRGEVSSDPAVRVPVMADLNVIRYRILDATGASGRVRSVASAGLAGWIAFVREVSIEWLQYREIDRDDVIALCITTVVSAVGPDLDLPLPPRW